MSNLYAVRHGETEWNAAGKQQGHLDSPLTALGTQQAHALARGLKSKAIDVIYSSDLGRAAATAKIIAGKLGLDIQFDERLRERHLGCMQGFTKDQFKELHPAEWELFSTGDPDYQLPGGERARQRYSRSVSCVEDLVKRHAGEVVLIVAHGGVLNSLFYRCLQIPLSEPRRFSLFNSAINSFTVTGADWRLDSWGDTSHLGELHTLDDN